ncbi:methylmalonyl-CoA mutase family protein [Pseudonocardia bannensis]|uniref:methylmalonyl-CoA mutase n=1 Tax=Pseudonocardia bannensis TaxID=630973 RepID=A0A848DLG9_9PSEU|nr:methylmalonyl-CoA mutase family protein [Pseudonocardia bannensis]NMH93356.1 methylmalonyl-CoA mutase [Pseudonocardia bannensis]
MSTPQVDTDALDRGAPEEPDELVLAGEFPAPTVEEWSTLVDGVVRKAGRIPADAADGAGVEKLTWTTPDGIRVRPLYTAEDTRAEPGVPGRAPFVRGSRAAGYVPEGWDVRQRHADPDPEAAEAAITADLENGVTSIWLGAGPNGTAVTDLPAVLADVYLDLAPVVLDAGPAAEEAAEAFLALAADRGVAAGELLGNLGLDPIGLRARTGDGPAVESVVELARRVAADHPKLRAIVVDALPVHEAGGSDAQELGWSLASGLAYLRVLTGAGVDLDTATRLLEFRYAATAEQFATIAKLRAARRLWSRVTEVCGAAAPQHQHAVSSSVMQSRRDPWVNLLRGTVAGFAAGVGGADAVTVAPFDSAIGVSEPFSRRIARNTQALLIEESHLARVIDPAGGSWYVEHLTDDLAQAAWAFFQEIEAAGGAVAALDAGLIADRTAEVRAAREKAVAHRRVPLTGVSEFPNLDEKPVERRPHPERPHNGGLPVFRPAEPFEAYRDRSDARLESAGARPTAFLATLGSPAAYTARAGFARNLLQAGGISAPEAGPTESAEDVATAFADAGTPVAVLCSTDALYAERAEATVAALHEAGARTVLLAGKPSEPPIPGIDGYLYAGCDALAVIENVYEALEVAK